MRDSFFQFKRRERLQKESSIDDRFVYIMGIATDKGLTTKGSDLAPRILFRHFRLDKRLEDIGLTIPRDPEKNFIEEELLTAIEGPEQDEKKRVRPISVLCERVANEIKRNLDEIREQKKYSGYHALFLGGDHSVAMGTYAGVANHFGEKLGVLWIDAHGDFHVWRTSESKNVHGMALAAILGKNVEPGGRDEELFECCPTQYKPAPEDVFVLGVRDLDGPEITRFGNSGINVYTSTDVERLSLREILERICKKLKRNGITRLHVSLDLDVFDPLYAPGTSTPVEAGLTPREVLFIGEYLAREDLVFSLDIVEYNITNDLYGKTALLATRTIPHFLGKRSYPELMR